MTLMSLVIAMRRVVFDHARRGRETVTLMSRVEALSRLLTRRGRETVTLMSLEGLINARRGRETVTRMSPVVILVPYLHSISTLHIPTPYPLSISPSGPTAQKKDPLTPPLRGGIIPQSRQRAHRPPPQQGEI